MPATGRYTLTLRQHTPATPGQPDKQPVPIPVRMALFDHAGRALPLTPEGQAPGDENERVLVLDGVEASFVFTGVGGRPDPVPAARLLGAGGLRVRLRRPGNWPSCCVPTPTATTAGPPASAWPTHAFDALHAGDPAPAALAAWTEALDALFDDETADPSLLAELLTPAPARSSWPSGWPAMSIPTPSAQPVSHCSISSPGAWARTGCRAAMPTCRPAPMMAWMPPARRGGA